MHWLYCCRATGLPQRYSMLSASSLPALRLSRTTMIVLECPPALCRSTSMAQPSIISTAIIRGCRGHLPSRRPHPHMSSTDQAISSSGHPIQGTTTATRNGGPKEVLNPSIRQISRLDMHRELPRPIRSWMSSESKSNGSTRPAVCPSDISG